ncbi:MAG: hypothetical protein ACKVH8_09095 [Pirellulales bacterium]|jgi:hypothetical protein
MFAYRLTSLAVVLILLFSLAGCADQTPVEFSGTWEGPVLVQDYRIEDIGTGAKPKTTAMILRLEFLKKNKLRLTSIQGDQSTPTETEYHVTEKLLDEFTLKLGTPEEAGAHSIIIRFDGKNRLIFKQEDGHTRVNPIEMKKVS